MNYNDEYVYYLFTFDMRIAVYSGYGAGFGDLSAGKKLASMARDQYPDATVTQYTNSLAVKGQAFKEALTKFDPAGDIQPVDLKKKYPRSDLILVGPMIEDTEHYIRALGNNNKSVPIILMAEYDCGESKGDVLLQQSLREKGFKHVYIQRMGMEKGLGLDAAGIFIDKTITDKAVKPLASDLSVTADSLLEGKDIETYQKSRSISVSYSHRNFKRMLNVHLGVTPAKKDSDLIILGEEVAGDPRDLPILKKKAAEILDAGYSTVVYATPAKAPITIADSDTPGPVYRVVHTGRVPAEEAKTLRQLSNHFVGGATGDQSFSEAISGTAVCVYETQPWKMNFTVAMIELADKVEAKIDTRTIRPINRERETKIIMDVPTIDDHTIPFCMRIERA